MKAYIVSIFFILAIIVGVTHNHAFNLDPLMAEIKREQKAIIKAIAVINHPIQTWNDFIAKGALIAKKYDIPPAVLLGQAALESAHGTSARAINQNNYFGLAVYSDYATGLDFSTPEASIEYYAQLISTKPVYARAYNLRHNPYRMIEAIWEAGYATDPLYVYKVTNTWEFKQFAK